ncbi:RNA recognition motif domain-containing protein, partial [Candidatus Neomarinimicrobiota bacterium]
MKKIYVGNLPFSATQTELEDLFATYGTVNSINLINDRDTGRFRGFGFVEMAEADADAAIKGLDGKDMGDRAMKVNEAKARESRPQANRW